SKGMGSVACYDQEIGPRVLEATGHGEERRCRVCAFPEQECGTVGYLRLAVDENVQVVLIAHGSCCVDNPPVEVDRGRRPHASEDTDRLSARMPFPGHGPVLDLVLHVSSLAQCNRTVNVLGVSRKEEKGMTKIRVSPRAVT